MFPQIEKHLGHDCEVNFVSDELGKQFVVYLEVDL